MFVASIERPFHGYGYPLPNYQYRAWLEENVGKQYIDWTWEIIDTKVGDDVLTILFKRKEDALAFQLRWP